MKLKELESYLQQVSVFEKPVAKWEQYPTTPHLASHMLYNIDKVYNDINEKRILDLGVGCGILSIGSMILGSAYNVGVDIDFNALEIARENCANFELDMEFINADISNLYQMFKFDEDRRPFDVTIMNPPFGTKNKGIDMIFLKNAIQLSETAVYSLHKSSTRQHILRSVKAWGVEGKVVAQLRYNLSNSYKFHKKQSVDIDVDFIRFEIVNPRLNLFNEEVNVDNI